MQQTTFTCHDCTRNQHGISLFYWSPSLGDLASSGRVEKCLGDRLTKPWWWFTKVAVWPCGWTLGLSSKSYHPHLANKLLISYAFLATPCGNYWAGQHWFIHRRAVTWQDGLFYILHPEVTSWHCDGSQHPAWSSSVNRTMVPFRWKLSGSDKWQGGDDTSFIQD